jgi:glucose/mannose transport system substrate-binding protein
MTIMGDWGKGYANAAGFDEKTFGVMPTPGTAMPTAKTFVFTTDTFGMPLGALHKEDTLNMLRVFGSREGQDVFNPKKGSISARRDSHIDDPAYDAMAKQTFDDFVTADVIVPATSIAAPHVYIDAISAALADFAKALESANPSTVQHTMKNYEDLLLASCWPKPAANCPNK